MAAIHIDANNVESRKDNPRVWLEYKEGYGFLAEEETNKIAAVPVQSFSTGSSTTQAPAQKRRRQSNQEQTKESDQAQSVAKHQPPRPSQPTSGKEVYPDGNKGIARTLYGTPASTRRNINLVNQFIDSQI